MQTCNFLQFYIKYNAPQMRGKTVGGQLENNQQQLINQCNNKRSESFCSNIDCFPLTAHPEVFYASFPASEKHNVIRIKHSVYA